MRSIRLAASTGLAMALVVHAPSAGAAPQRLTLDPDGTAISFTLGATLHSVEGDLRLAGGEIHFDPETGAAAGELVVDATSARTGIDLRDRNMHRNVLESERYPRIVFRAERLRVVERQAQGGRVELEGVLDMHGKQRPFVLPARLSATGDRVAIETRFRVPYVDWGMRDESTLLLRVDRYVDVTVRAEGRVAPVGRE
jgi:polyisoprenoid-binding protein YceI